MERVRFNLKIILCFSPVNKNFRIKLKKFPSLIASTNHDYFHAWPKDIVIDVANSS